MTKPKMIIMMGISGSGKSTHAQKLLKEIPKSIRTNRDSLREMMLCGRGWNPKVEKIVMATAKSLVTEALAEGYTIIVDDTNTTIKQRAVWLSLAQEASVPVTVIHMTETENNVDNRMTEPRGMTKSEWIRVINSQKKNFQPLSNRERIKATEVRGIEIR